MTERLADIRARIDSTVQLGAVVNAMRGIAATRAQQARAQLPSVDSYASIIAAAIGRSLALLPPTRSGSNTRRGRRAIVLFCAEQGFAGAFSERVLDAAGEDLSRSELFLIGTRGIQLAAERHLSPRWTHAMPSHSAGIPRLADHIADAVYDGVATGEIDRIDAMFTRWQAGRGLVVDHVVLFPIETSAFARPAEANAPLVNLAPEQLLSDLMADYTHAQLCHAALHAFAAENEARMEAMAAARDQIEHQLSTLQARERIVRQEEITAEIIELSAGETASRAGLRRRRSNRSM